MLDQNIQNTLKEKLKDIFGYGQFRGEQEKIIESIIGGNNTFVIMPTGAGKSLCYQLPAMVLDGTAIIISPLIALMKNQVDQMNGFGINAQFLNSTLNKAEMTRVKSEVLSGECKLLYIAPESLTKQDNLNFLKKANISFVAVDEAHCISEWGHDFRPEYRRIKSIVEDLSPTMPIIALTATATPKVQQDIQKNLNMEDSCVFKSSFNRKNLYYEIRPKLNDINKQVIRYIKNHKGKSGIIYCLSRKSVEEVAQLLILNDIKAAPYHAGLDSDTRMKNQDAFLNEEVDVVCATIAFGMGIDKPDVRFVIHYDAPKSLEGYYQETGRAGRDGLEGNCLMFYAFEDIQKLEKFNKDKTVTERENAKALLMEMVAYSNVGLCRRRQLLSYFGEHFAKDCGMCDNCQKPTEKFKVEKEVLWIIEAILATEERFDGGHIADIVNGYENPYTKSHNHDKLPVFGKGAVLEQNIDFWQSVIKQLVILDYLEKDMENYGIVKVSAKGLKYKEDAYPITLSKDHNYQDAQVVANNAEEDASNQNAGGAFDETLLEMLKVLRKRIAKEKGVPPYVVFQDPSLEEMATVYPTTKEELAQINGVGMGKVVKFGKAFVDLITNYVDENDIETTKDLVVKSMVNKSKMKIFIIQQVDRKIDLNEIAEAKSISMPELIEEIEHICYSGTKLNLDYYLNQIIDEERQEEIYEYFMAAESDNIKVALKNIGDNDINEEELRLIRIKFMSEMAN
jgi:ATP-dependent DNA helicase RecQ